MCDVCVASLLAKRQRYACFNTILELSCPGAGDQLMFDSALYGRNDTLGSVRCRVPYDRKCQIDVQNLLNMQCGGMPRCSLAVNTAVFDDPCGYDEFLTVNYRCLPGIYKKSELMLMRRATASV